MHDFYLEEDSGWTATHGYDRHDPNPNPRTIFVQDNARIQTAKYTQNASRESNIYTMRWPANSPNLNPIENVWVLLKFRINKRQPPPLTKQEMTDAINEKGKFCNPKITKPQLIVCPGAFN